MKKHGHYCKVCGCYRADEKFSGRGHAAHICKSCAALPPEQQAEQIVLTRIAALPVFLNKSDIAWLKIRMNDHRSAVKQAAIEAYNTQFQK